MRVAVVSNCQVFGLSSSFQTLGDDITADAFVIHELTQDPGILDRIDADYDHVFAGLFSMPLLEGRDAASRTTLVPEVYFSAFHPDFVNVMLDGKALKGPLDDYHSLIAFESARRGLTVRQAADLFETELFEQAGYLDEWDASRQALFDRFARAGQPGEDAFYRWCRRGIFMHTFNHPKIWVLADIAADALQTAGIPAGPPADDIPDNLVAAAILPVYEGLAERLGVHGSFRFKPAKSTQTLDLEEFLTRSLEFYASIDLERTELMPHHRRRADRLSAALD